MSESDGRLAKVTYLSSVPRPSDSAHSDDGWYVEPENRQPTKSARRGPVFVETPDTAEHVAPAPPHKGATNNGKSHTPAGSSTSAAPLDGPNGMRESPAMQKMRQLVEAADHARFTDESDEPAEETDAELAARAETISMRALTRKGMSSWEMEDKLRAQGLDDNVVMTEVERLERVGLLNDYDLAETLVRTLQDRKGLGRSGITAELRRRHVDQEAIEVALDALDSNDEQARANEIAVRRAGQLRSYDTVTAKRRLSAFMMRKGYSGAVIQAAVAAALEPGRGPRFE